MRINSEWIKQYGDICKSLYTKKTVDWEYEQEVRGIIFDYNYQYTSEQTRKIFYEPNKLKGIIFGNNTSVSDKLKVMEILSNKKSALDDNFKLYQAYFSNNNKETKIKIYPLSIEL